MKFLIILKHILISLCKRFGILPTSEAEKALSKLRLRICARCPLVKVSKLLELVNGEADYIDNLYCTKCKCWCEGKSLIVKEKCPIESW